MKSFLIRFMTAYVQVADPRILNGLKLKCAKIICMQVNRSLPNSGQVTSLDNNRPHRPVPTHAKIVYPAFNPLGLQTMSQNRPLVISICPDQSFLS
jgi:hypothetical protein